MNYGAQKNIKNADGKTPVEVAGLNKETRECLGDFAMENNSDVIDDSSFVPNYLRYPVLNSKVDSVQGRKTEKINYETEQIRILKIRKARDADQDFIEIDVPQSKLNFENLKEIMCQELEVNNSHRVERIRKLPNTRLRRDIEVARLDNYSELELELLKM